jgi:formate dehydrogenase alpha subunit
VSDSRARLDGREVDAATEPTILEAATRLSIDIPILCHVPGCAPAAWCRLCLVEPSPGAAPVAACHTKLRPGMDVRTSTPRLEALRRGVLRLIAGTDAGRAAAQADPGSDLRRLMDRLGVAAPPGRRAAGAEVDASHPLLRFDRDLCIACRRCVSACQEIQGQFVFAIEGRGPRSQLAIGPGSRFADSACVACGSCVDHCPTGALSDVDRDSGAGAVRRTRSVCGYCGVGCRIEIESSARRVRRVGGVAEAAVNHGHLCLKGRYGHAWHHSHERLTRPLRRGGGGWEEIGWDEATRWAARRLLEVRAARGPSALGGLSSSRSTNESAYLLQKLFRTRLGTNNVDCCARVCHSSTALALGLTTGTGAASASFADIERARCIVIAGANPTESHPVIGARIKQAALRGATLLVIDPRRTELAEYAAVHLALRPGANVALFNGLARCLIEMGRVDDAYLAQRTEGYEELSRFLAAAPLARWAGQAGVDAGAIEGAAALLGGAGPALFVSGLGLSETTQGTVSVMALANLGMLTGSIGRPGAGMLPLRGQNNVQGAADMGGMPDKVTGYQPLDDPEVRARLERLWGAAPPPRPGLTSTQMMIAARRGELRGLWAQGQDLAQSDPDQDRVLEALRSLDLLIVQDLFMSETARLAHLILPAAGALEQEGTFTNGERRIQLVRPAVAPPGEARPDWRVVRDVALALGAEWPYGSPAEVMDEIANVAPHLFGGVAYERLGGDGLQWPCPSRDHPGTATLHAERFMRGRGRLVAVDFEPAPEHDVEGFPFLLMTGRVLEQYNVGTMTRRTPVSALAPADVLEINPDDARDAGVAEGQPVRLESRWGETVAPARLSSRVAPGTLFLSFHFPHTHTNRLVGPHLDPHSACPGYKVTAVRLRGA